MIRVLVGAALGYTAGAAYTTFMAGQGNGSGFSVPMFGTSLKNYQAKPNLIGAGVGAALGWYTR